MESKRLANVIPRDLFVLEDESNPRGSKVDQIWPSTTLDQVFDDQSPVKKTLREILEDLKVEILTGGRGNIVFPVTSVNGKTDDVVLTKADVGLGRVDNTADIDKPLSVPQRSAIMDILKNYDFNVDLHELYDHLMDMNNPHKVSLDQLNNENVLDDYINELIQRHNTSNYWTVHTDIRRNLSALWQLVDTINNSLEDRLAHVLDCMDEHEEDMNAHGVLMQTKEDIANKVLSFSNTTDNNHTKYPSTRAVVEFVENKLVEYKENNIQVTDWIDDIKVVNSRSNLPSPTAKYFRKAYFVCNGNTSHDEIAICRKNADNTYSWDITPLGSYSKFNPTYFMDTPDGMSINMGAVIDAMLSENGMLDGTLSEVLKDYYTKDEIDTYHYISNIKILPGTVDGTIRFYINNDMTTMTDDIPVAGLKRLAYLEWVTDKELWDNSVWSKHIIDKAIETRHIQDKAVTINKLNCSWGNLLGNTEHPEDNSVNEVKLTELADVLRPLIGGWPDPNTPGGNPWFDMLADQLVHPQVWLPNLEHDLQDKSYGIRFTGDISQIPNQIIEIKLSEDINTNDNFLIDCGGTWQYQSEPEEWTTMGGSNITGHTFATIVLKKDGLFFESISIGDRMHAKYDIWVKYAKKKELVDGQYQPY